MRRSTPIPARAPGPARRAIGAVVLGIDPGTRVVGWGAVRQGPAGLELVAADVLRLQASLDLPQRLGLLRNGLDRLIAELRPAVVVVEEAFAARNPQSALRIGEGRGVVIACASVAGCAVQQYPPAVPKKTLVGNGAAHKTQVAFMVARLLGLAEPPRPLDATDALSLALTHAMRCKSHLTGVRNAPAAAGARSSQSLQ
jgi:crossover junction endodeoxyribonuclease RuvC